MRDLSRRVGDMERATGRTPADEARIKADAAAFDAKIADMAARCSHEERENMQEWWAMCRAKFRTDPVLAKVFAGFEPGDVNL